MLQRVRLGEPQRRAGADDRRSHRRAPEIGRGWRGLAAVHRFPRSTRVALCVGQSGRDMVLRAQVAPEVKSSCDVGESRGGVSKPPKEGRVSLARAFGPGVFLGSRRVGYRVGPYRRLPNNRGRSACKTCMRLAPVFRVRPPLSGLPKRSPAGQFAHLPPGARHLSMSLPRAEKVFALHPRTGKNA